MSRSHSLTRRCISIGLALACSLAQAQVVQNRQPATAQSGGRFDQRAKPPDQNVPDHAPRSELAPAAGTPSQTDRLKLRDVPKMTVLPITQCLPEVLGRSIGQGGASLTLICNVPKQPLPWEFQVSSNEYQKVIKDADQAGFTVEVSYDEVAPAGPNGAPKRVMTGVREALLSRTQVVCVPQSSRIAETMTVGNKDGSYPPVTLWCTDGKRIRPIAFLPNKQSITAINAKVEDGPIKIQFHQVLGGYDSSTGRNSPYPIHSSYQLMPYPWPDSKASAVGTTDKNLAYSPQNTTPGNSGYHRYSFTDVLLAGPIVRCGGEDTHTLEGGSCNAWVAVPGKPGARVLVGYRPYLPNSVAAGVTEKQPNRTKSVGYVLMPGIVAAEHRAASGGACRVAINTYLRFEMTNAGVSQGSTSGTNEIGYDTGQRTAVGAPPGPPPVVVPDRCD